MRLIVIFGTLLSIINTAHQARAQNPIPNPGFEKWDSIPAYGLLPQGWLGGNAKRILNPIYESTDAHSGSFALAGRVISAGDSTEPPNLETISLPSEGGTLTVGFPVKGSPTGFEGWLKFNSVGMDAMIIYVYYNNGCIAIFEDSASHKEYTHFSIPLPPTHEGIMMLSITVENHSQNRHVNTHIGTEFLLDDLSLSWEAKVKPTVDRYQNGLMVHYPNQVNPMTTVTYSLSEDDYVSIDIINPIGERVWILKAGRQISGKHEVALNTERLRMGTYICRLSTVANGISNQIFQVLH